MKLKTLVVALLVALVLVPAAGARFRMWLTISDSTPRLGQTVTVAIHSERDLD